MFQRWDRILSCHHFMIMAAWVLLYLQQDVIVVVFENIS
jgi:hypothetical protein